MGAFDEIVSGGPYAVYIAPVGQAMPIPWSPTPHKPWVLLGVHGPLSMTETGIAISQSQTINKVYALGTTAPVEAFRVQEEFEISFEFHDLTPGTWGKILRGVNGAVEQVTPGGGRGGYRTLDLLRGGKVEQFAVCVRLDVSPHDDTLTSQFEIPRAIQSADQAPTFDKGSTPAVLAATFTALFDPHQGTTARWRTMYAPWAP